MEIIKREVKSCCGKIQKVWKLSTPIQQKDLPIFESAGFTYLQSFLDAGQIYLEDKGVSVVGVFGLPEIRIKCKNKLECENSCILLENTIMTHL